VLRLLAASAALSIAGCTSSSDAVVSNTTPAPAVTAVSDDDGVFQRTTDGTGGTADEAITDTQTTTGAPTTTTTTLPPTNTTTTTTTTSTTTTTTTLPAGTVAGELDFTANSQVIGTSIEGRPITAERFGNPGDRRVLVIGVIHGNEDGGVPVINELRGRALGGSGPDGIELWLIESMNPDGQAAQVRHNANQVDLNRNFPLRWGPIGQPGDGQYAGAGPASEAETQAIVSFISQLRPDLAVWYHQDANLIIPSSGRDGRIRARYAELSGLPVADCCDGGIYTGIAATWARDELAAQEGVAFIVELPGGDLSGAQVLRHADTVSMIATELAIL
jgi:protein MpaA